MIGVFFFLDYVYSWSIIYVLHVIIQYILSIYVIQFIIKYIYIQIITQYILFNLLFCIYYSTYIIQFIIQYILLNWNDNCWKVISSWTMDGILDAYKIAYNIYNK